MDNESECNQPQTIQLSFKWDTIEIYHFLCLPLSNKHVTKDFRSYDCPFVERHAYVRFKCLTALYYFLIIIIASSVRAKRYTSDTPIITILLEVINNTLFYSTLCSQQAERCQYITRVAIQINKCIC